MAKTEIKIPELTCEGCKGRDRINKALAERVDQLETAERMLKALSSTSVEKFPTKKVREFVDEYFYTYPRQK